MIIHKFGGGILKTPEAVRKLADNMLAGGRPAWVVVSALSKMTNTFEKVAKAWYENRDTEPDMQMIRGFHFDMVCRLFPDPDASWEKYLKPVFAEIQALLLQHAPRPYDRAYDQIVCYGEILSTALLRTYFEEQGISHVYLDARDLILTDTFYREGGVQWAETIEKVKGARSKEEGEVLVLTQGFIGRTTNGDSVTLGREGSDYSAAIFAYCLEAEEIWIWKDVPGILNADPTEFTDTVKLDSLSYHEVIELAYFGAKVIHPKTIKPLQNKSIPLWVRDFWNPDGTGTRITDLKILPPTGPIFIRKANQVLISFQPRDFSFIVEDTLSEIFAALAKYRIKVNLMQHGAVSLTICVTADMDRINSLIQAMLPKFRVLYNSELELVTIRRYTPEAIARMTEGKRIMVQQLSRKTARFVLA
jgi:aspartate kinase